MAGGGVLRAVPGLGGGGRPQLIGNAERIPARPPSLAGSAREKTRKMKPPQSHFLSRQEVVMVFKKGNMILKWGVLQYIHSSFPTRS